MDSQCARPNDATSESGYGSLVGSGQDVFDSQHQHELSSPSITSPLLSQQVSQPGEANFYGTGGSATFDELAGIGEGPSADHHDGDRQSFGIHGTYNEFPELGDAALTAAAMEEIMLPMDPVMCIPDWPEVRVGFYGATSEPYIQNEVVSVKQPDGEISCSQCGKVKKRECDLRKHMKRHSRPYGCTFPRCWKRFGSHHDWKRHESSQHFLNEEWRCELYLVSGQKCGKLVSNEEDMHTHLRNNHADVLQHETVTRGVLMGVLLHHLAANMHLGREAHQHFFCGFCNKLIKQGPGIPDAFEERARHIGEHYDKGDSNIDDWVCVEGNKPKRDIARLDRQKAEQRVVVNVTAEEDSDLGESGIVDEDFHVAKRRRMFEEVDVEGACSVAW